jgi:hypothetical protein
MSTAEERMQNYIEELEQENRLLRARNERLEREGEMRRLDLLDTLKESTVQKPDAMGCHLPPHGWRCTRTANHDGPCAAVESPEDIELVASAVKRLCEAAPPAQPAPVQEPVAWNQTTAELASIYGEMCTINVKESDASSKWKAVKTVLYLLFFGFIAMSILAGIVILF